MSSSRFRWSPSRENVYIYIPRARVCCSCCCVYLTVSCQHKAHTERRLFFPNNIHIKRREGKKCKNFSKTEMNSFTSCLFVCLLRRAFPSAFFSLFCLPFFLSLSLVCCFVTLRHHHKNTHPQKSHQTQFSLFLSLFRRRRRRRRRTRWSSVRVVSDLRFFPLVLVVGRA